jgi:hypothetical protein
MVRIDVRCHGPTFIAIATVVPLSRIPGGMNAIGRELVSHRRAVDSFVIKRHKSSRFMAKTVADDDSKTGTTKLLASVSCLRLVAQSQQMHLSATAVRQPSSTFQCRARGSAITCRPAEVT